MSVSEVSDSALNDLALSSDSRSLATQNTDTMSFSDASNQSSTENLENDELYGLPPPVADDSEEDATFVPERVPRGKGKGKAKVDESHQISSSEIDGDEQPQTFAHVYEDRPNRFLGPSSTWYTWTKEERDIADALKHERAKDLSAHLFNAFALKSRARNHRMKAISGEAGISSDDLESFKPPKSWTAWPMPPEEVPRETLKAIWDISEEPGYRMAPDLRPSADLEEICIAIGLQLSKDRYYARKSESASPGDSDAPKPPVEDELRPEEDMAIKAEETPSNLSPTSGSAGSNSFKLDEMYTSQPYESSEHAGGGEDFEISSESSHEDVSPTFLADDDDARSILRPVTRNLLSNLDKLLTGLHVIRASHATYKPNDRLRGASEEGTGNAASSSAASSIKKRETVRRSNKKITSTASDSVSSSQSRRTKNMRSSHRTPADVQISRLGLRDWSEVLGTAYITGWNPDVIARASQRCAALFGEDMLFRTFHEERQGGHEAVKAHVVEHTASGKEPAGNSEEALQPTGWLTEAEGGSEGEMEIETETEIEDNGPKEFHCTVPSCERGTHVFANWYQLQKHMRESHPVVTRGKKRKPIAASMESEAEITETEVENTPHDDKTEYPCPVEECARGLRPFSRPANLYNHIRKKHKAFDVEGFKKLQSKRRGEKRGKWIDHRRRRSRRRESSTIAGGVSDTDFDR